MQISNNLVRRSYSDLVVFVHNDYFTIWAFFRWENKTETSLHSLKRSETNYAAASFPSFQCWHSLWEDGSLLGRSVYLAYVLHMNRFEENAQTLGSMKIQTELLMNLKINAKDLVVNQQMFNI